MSTAEAVKTIRLSFCMEQKEFAALIGVSISTVSHYETSTRTPRLPIVKKLLELAKQQKIKISVEDFFN